MQTRFVMYNFIQNDFKAKTFIRNILYNIRPINFMF